MNFFYNIAVYDKSNQEIRLAIPRVMKLWGYDLASGEMARQVEYISENLLPAIDENLMQRKLLISPSKNKWSVICHTLWYSEAQEFGVLLSKEIEGIVLLYLMDDSLGWGYELFRNGETLDKFHTTPNSPTLNEQEGEFSFDTMNKGDTEEMVPNPPLNIDVSDLVKLLSPTKEQFMVTQNKFVERIKSDYVNGLSPDQLREFENEINQRFGKILVNLPTEEERSERLAALPDPTFLDRALQEWMPSPEQILEYQGQPSIFAKLFGLSEDGVAGRLSRSRDDFQFLAHEEMVDLFEKDLGINGWDKDYWGVLNQEDEEDLDEWAHSIYIKRMTEAEQLWCRMPISENVIPYTGPPIWINRQL